MTNQVEQKLIKPLYDALQRERFVTVTTIDFETGGPNITAISWIFAKDESTICFAVDNRSRMIQNISQNQLIAINLIANESVYSIQGAASVKQEKLQDVPIKLAVIEMKISEVRDIMFYGSKIVTEPEYDKTYDKRAAARLDQQVMEAIRKART